jgi:hypothetical protein
LTVQAAIEATGERDPDTIYVDFYASADTQITASDYCLGQVNLSLSMNAWVLVTLRCTFPTEIPPGTYYVGWIIDPGNINDETNELNNTAFNASSMLTVVGVSKPAIYVDLSARGARDGSSWDHAFDSLPDALAQAASGCEIRVADGVYTPDRGIGVARGDRHATFEMKSGVTLAGGYAGAGEPNPDARDTKIYLTILSGDLNGDDDAVADPCELWADVSRTDNSLHVVTAVNADRTTVLDGFYITGGCADGTGHDSRGAGMYIDGGGPHLLRCELSGNWAVADGGALFATDSSPELIDCTLCENAVGFTSQSDPGTGGAVFVDGGSPNLINCSVHGNFACGRGGAVVLGPGGSLSAINCCFHANRAVAPAGAIYALDSQAVLINCTFAGNCQDGVGGAIVCESSDDRDPSQLSIANCILWNHSQEIAGPGGSLIAVMYSDIQGGWLGIGNLDIDPLFVDPDGPDGRAGTRDDDLRLSQGSPCIDAGDAAALPKDATDLDGDGDTEEPLPRDCQGNDRVAGGEVDLGAYETGASNDATGSH